MSARYSQLIPAPEGCKAYYAPSLPGYKGDPIDLPMIVEEPVLAFALMEKGADQWIDAMVSDDDEGGLMPADELAGFLSTGSPAADGSFPAKVLVARIHAAQKKAGTVKGPDSDK
jgi:hypothetical protein